MERCNKYLVLKIADIRKYLSDEQQLKLDALNARIRVGRLNDGKQDQQYVCVAADWPMYEQVWGMIEAFVDNKPSEIEQLTARVRELEKQRDELDRSANLTKRLCVEMKEYNEQVVETLDDAGCIIANKNIIIDNLQARIAELEAENARLKAECDDIKQVQFPRKLEAVAAGWKKQLAAEQLNNKRLRDALEQVKESCLFADDDGGIGVSSEAQIDILLFDQICKALSLPASTEALDKYVAEKVKEAGKFDIWKTNPYTKVLETSIKQLTRQRDLAIEALEKTRGALAYVKANGRDNPNLMESTAWHGLAAADKALSTIKESDGM